MPMPALRAASGLKEDFGMPGGSLRRMLRSAAALLMIPVLLSGLVACEGNAPASRASKAGTAGEVFESFGGDALIEEETIVLPPEPVAPGDRADERRRRPISSPGAAPPGAAPLQRPPSE